MKVLSANSFTEKKGEGQWFAVEYERLVSRMSVVKDVGS